VFECHFENFEWLLFTYSDVIFCNYVLCENAKTSNALHDKSIHNNANRGDNGPWP
jgi:hypothetical protein